MASYAHSPAPVYTLYFLCKVFSSQSFGQLNITLCTVPRAAGESGELGFAQGYYCSL